jgi:hypothetical protein
VCEARNLLFAPLPLRAGPGYGPGVPSSIAGLVAGMRLLFAAVGVFTTIAGLATQSTVVALNSAGVIGLAGLVIGGGFYISMRDETNTPEEQIQRVKVTLIVLAIVTPLSAFLFFVVGEGLREEESGVNLLTIMGLVTLIFYAFIAAAGWKMILPEIQDTKTCPDCANQVLQAARKCQHCGYRFEPQT